MLITRRACLATAVGAAANFALSGSPRAAQSADFARWVAGFRIRELRRGMSEATYDRVMNALTPDTSVFEQFRAQPEFTEQVWQYINRRCSDWRVITGKQRAIEYAGLLARIERDYGVDRYIMLCRRYNMTRVNERDRFDPAQVQVRRAAIQLSPATYEAYAGRYKLIDAPTDLVNALGEIVTLSVEDERFVVESRQGKMQFYPETEVLFTAALDRNITLLLQQDAQGQVTGLVITLLDGREVCCRKLGEAG